MNGDFMPEPSMLLKDEAELRKALNKTDWKSRPHPFQYRIKSLWLIALIGEIAAKEYPYNAVVHKEARKRLGFAELSDAENAREGTPLSTLIYNAQNYRRSDELIAQGFTEFTDQMVKDAFAQKRKIQTKDGKLYNVRKVGDKLYAFAPRQRKKALLANVGTAAKIVSK